MSKKPMTVGELKSLLDGVSDDCKLKVSVTYDNCDHIQNLNDIYIYNNWVYLLGVILND